jgi:CAAX prenyl protease-like protein
MTRPKLEIAAVLLTGLVYVFFENVLHRKLEFLVPCALAWLTYLGWRIGNVPGQARDWGLRADNLKPATTAAALVAAVAIAGLVVLRLIAGWRPLPAHAWVVLTLYPVWALVQQFLAQALIARNLRLLGAPRAVIIPVAALLFGLAHVPDWPLVGLCAAAGLVWTTLYLRIPNLWPLAISHAVLGTLAYYWLLERDPWREFFPS